MTEHQIFQHLFSLISHSTDVSGAVAACLVRAGNIVAEGMSDNEGVHAEYALLKTCVEKGESIQEKDIVYTTVEPCGKRTPGGKGEYMGNCTTNLIAAGVKCVIFAAADPHASADTRHKFTEHNARLLQTPDKKLVDEAVRLFNATCANSADWLPVE